MTGFCGAIVVGNSEHRMTRENKLEWPTEKADI
jgi:hypothetical protein